MASSRDCDTSRYCYPNGRPGATLVHQGILEHEQRWNRDPMYNALDSWDDQRGGTSDRGGR